jgi:hypothetical protein
VNAVDEFDVINVVGSTGNNIVCNVVISTKVGVKSIGNIAGAATELTIFWGFEPLVGFNSL